MPEGDEAILNPETCDYEAHEIVLRYVADATEKMAHYVGQELQDDLARCEGQ